MQVLMEEEDEVQTEEDGNDSPLSQLIEIKKKIANISRRLCKLKLLTSASSKASPLTSVIPASETGSSDVKQSGSELGEHDTNKPRKSSVVKGSPSLSSGVTEVEGHATVPPTAQNEDTPDADVKGHATVPPTVQTDDTPVADELKSELSLEEASAKVPSEEKGELSQAMPTQTPDREVSVQEEVRLEESVNNAVADGRGVCENVTGDVTATVDHVAAEGERWDIIPEDVEEPILQPTVSKSYSSATATPPTCKMPHPQRHRASSLPPPPTSPDKLIPSQVLVSHQRPPTPAVHSLRPHSNFIPIPSASQQAVHSLQPHSNFIPIPSASQQASIPEWPALGSLLPASKKGCQPTSPPKCPTVGSASPPKWPTVGSASSPKWPTVGSASPPKWPTVGSASPPKWSSAAGPGSPPKWSSAAGPGSPPKWSSTTSNLPTHAVSYSASASPPKLSGVGSQPIPTKARPGSSSAGLLLSPPSATSQPPNWSSVISQPTPMVVQPGSTPSSSGTGFLLPNPTSSQLVPPPKFTSVGVPNVALSGSSGDPPVKKRPVGLGRGGRPLPPLESNVTRNSYVGRGIPPVRPLLAAVPMSPYMGQHRPPLLSPPPRPFHVRHPTPAPVPIPLAPEERWIYANHRRQWPKFVYSKLADFPPMGSGAGLDII